MKGAPVYLRDLNSDMQSEIIRGLENQKKLSVLQAIKNGDDVTVGYYISTPEVA